MLQLRDFRPQRLFHDGLKIARHLVAGDQGAPGHARQMHRAQGDGERKWPILRRSTYLDDMRGPALMRSRSMVHQEPVEEILAEVLPVVAFWNGVHRDDDVQVPLGKRERWMLLDAAEGLHEDRGIEFFAHEGLDQGMFECKPRTVCPSRDDLHAPSCFSSTQSRSACCHAPLSQADRSIRMIGRSLGSAFAGMPPFSRREYLWRSRICKVGMWSMRGWMG
jgi:hypothetical protein